MARTALLWLTYSKRPLYLDELAEAGALSPESCTLDRQDRLFDPHEILDICSGLVTSIPEIIRDSRNYPNYEVYERERELLRFAHFSVKEYLISDRITKGNASDFAILEPEAQTFLAQVCISYLLLFNDYELSSAEDVYSKPLLEYAARFWHVHASNNVMLPAKTVSQMHNLFRPHKGASFLNWLRVYEPMFDIILSASLQMGKPLRYFGSPLYYASFLGRLEVASSLVDEGADVNAQNDGYASVLQAAAAHDAESVVQLLLKAGADVNAQGGVYRSALQVAVLRGAESVVPLLLKEGAEVNAQGGRYGSALQAAARLGAESLVPLLLKAGADVNAQEGEYGSALQVAAARGAESVVQLLLKAGADVNAQGGRYGSALQAAAATGAASVIQLLLKAGADVNAQGRANTNALYAAVVYGAESVVHLLLKAGVDVNAQGGVYGSVLQVAAADGAESIVQLLLDAGADINAQGGKHGCALEVAVESPFSWNNGSGALQLLRAGAEVPPKLEDSPVVQKALAILKQEATGRKVP